VQAFPRLARVPSAPPFVKDPGATASTVFSMRPVFMVCLSPACQRLLKGTAMSFEFENSFMLPTGEFSKLAGNVAAHLSFLLKEFGSSN
jgi:hypothetical protein